MVVTVRLSTPFREVTGGKGEVRSEGGTPAELFDNMENSYPGFKELVFEGEGKIHDYVHIFINGEDYRPLGGLESKLSDGDVVSILFAISGG